MGFVAIVSDSTAGLPADYVAQHKVRIVPLYVKIGDVSYRDGVDISAAEFYERLPHCDVLPTTSQPSVGDFAAAYQALAQEGATDIVSVHLSSGISGTINSARLASEQVDVPVHLVDTLCAGGRPSPDGGDRRAGPGKRRRRCRRGGSHERRGGDAKDQFHRGYPGVSLQGRAHRRGRGPVWIAAQAQAHPLPARRQDRRPGGVRTTSKTLVRWPNSWANGWATSSPSRPSSWRPPAPIAPARDGAVAR